MRTLALLLMLCLSLAASISAAEAGTWRHDVPDARFQELAKQPQFDPVCLILKDDKPNASGVLVDDRWVLTAGHEVAGAKVGQYRARIGARTCAIDHIVMHPAYQAKGLGHGVDLALLHLTDACSDIAPAKVYRGHNELHRAAVTVGYGRSGAGASIITSPGPVGTKRAGYNIIDAIGGTIDGRILPDNFLIADFDDPEKSEFNRLGDAKPHELEYCPVGGDSGGGLFIEQDGQWFLACVVSSFTIAINDDLDDGIYGTVIYWTRLSLYAPWIDDVTHAG